MLSLRGEAARVGVGALQQHVGRLEVAVHDAQVVEVPDPQSDVEQRPVHVALHRWIRVSVGP